MNEKLTEEIAYHVLANLGVLPSNFVDLNQTRFFLDKQFLLPDKTSFQSEDGEILQKNIYGCQISVTDKKEFKMLLADCSQEKIIPEFALIIQLKDAPVFGVYLIYNKLVEDPPQAEAMIAVNTEGKYWIPCNIYLQATFLAGMEQLRDMSFGWSKCKDYKELYIQLLSFIKFHDSYFEVSSDERQEI
jgi:hypothetical protein